MCTLTLSFYAKINMLAFSSNISLLALWSFKQTPNSLYGHLCLYSFQNREVQINGRGGLFDLNIDTYAGIGIGSTVAQ